MLISGYPKWPSPKESSLSEGSVLLTSRSDMFLSILRCTWLIKAPHITIDAAKPEPRQAVDTAQVLGGSAWITGQLLSARAEPTLFCKSGGQKQGRELHVMVLLGMFSVPRSPWKHAGTWETQVTSLWCNKGGCWSVTAAAPGGLLGEHPSHQGFANGQEDLSKLNPERKPPLSV